MKNIIEENHVMAYDEYEWTENDSVVMFEGFCRKFPQAMWLKRIFLILSLVSMLANDMRGSRHQKLIWIGPISENIGLRVVSVMAKFQSLSLI